MRCPFCSEPDTRVIDSRLAEDGERVRRRRECTACQERFTTYEAAELSLPRLIKSDGRREPFIEDKLRAGMLRALEKRPVALEDVEHRSPTSNATCAPWASARCARGWWAIW